MSRGTPLSGSTTASSDFNGDKSLFTINCFYISAPRYKSQKFKDWLMVGVNVEPKPNPLAIEVLCYMAYETVAEVIICGKLLF